jgi:hypothetical protein
MTTLVPYLSDEVVEKDAQALLAEYARARGVSIGPPIAIDDIIEKHLKISIEFDDTHQLFNVPRATGSVPISWVRSSSIRSGSSSMKASIPMPTRPRRGATAIRPRTRLGIGVYIVACSAGTRHKRRSSIPTRRQALYAD